LPLREGRDTSRRKSSNRKKHRSLKESFLKERLLSGPWLERSLKRPRFANVKEKKEECQEYPD